MCRDYSKGKDEKTTLKECQGFLNINFRHTSEQLNYNFASE